VADRQGQGRHDDGGDDARQHHPPLLLPRRMAQPDDDDEVHRDHQPGQTGEHDGLDEYRVRHLRRRLPGEQDLGRGDEQQRGQQWLADRGRGADEHVQCQADDVERRSQDDAGGQPLHRSTVIGTRPDAAQERRGGADDRGPDDGREQDRPGGIPACDDQGDRPSGERHRTDRTHAHPARRSEPAGRDGQPVGEPAGHGDRRQRSRYGGKRLGRGQPGTGCRRAALPAVPGRRTGQQPADGEQAGDRPQALHPAHPARRSARPMYRTPPIELLSSVLLKVGRTTSPGCWHAGNRQAGALG